MGIVYQAFDPVVERHVAIKTIHFDNFHPQMLELLKREAKSVGQFEHPNIITLYDAAEADGLFYMVMQLVKGETLRERIQRQRWYKMQQVVDIFRQILAGLNYAHEHGVIHRDIKPANIMITFDGAIKLADFGVSKLIGPAASSSGVVVGTPSYMAPEQVLGRAVDGRSDLFALGCVLYEVVTGEKAYSGDSATAVMYKIVHQAPIPPASLRPGMDTGLEKVVLKALSNDPDDRFADCKEMSKALEDCLARCTVQASRIVELPSVVPPVQPGITAPRVGVTPASSRWGFRAAVLSPARVLATTGILAALVMGGMLINTRRTGLSTTTAVMPPTANQAGPPAVPPALAVSSGTVVPPDTDTGFTPPGGAPTRPPQVDRSAARASSSAGTRRCVARTSSSPGISRFGAGKGSPGGPGRSGAFPRSRLPFRGAHGLPHSKSVLPIGLRPPSRWPRLWFAGHPGRRRICRERL